jgi:ABC-type amino acid transport substrate-binding protein
MRLVALLALCASLFLVGCATTPPQQPIALASDWDQVARSGRVGVLVSALPKPDTAFPGADCLLCMGVAAAMHSSLTTHVRTLTTDELKPLQADLVALLKARGIDAVAIDEPLKMADLPDFKTEQPLNKSRKDFSRYKAQHNVARLLVVDIASIGIWRSFSGYVPTETPRAVVNGRAFVVDLAGHQLEWLHTLEVRRAAEGEWSEAPKYPGLTNAYYQALDTALEELKKPFAKR